jgi:hypothetical protein
LDKDIHRNAILIDSSPEIMLHALDPDEHLVELPLISGPWPTTSQTIGEIRTEFLHQRRMVSQEMSTPRSAGNRWR